MIMSKDWPKRLRRLTESHRRTLADFLGLKGDVGEAAPLDEKRESTPRKDAGRDAPKRQDPAEDDGHQ